MQAAASLRKLSRESRRLIAASLTFLALIGTLAVALSDGSAGIQHDRHITAGDVPLEFTAVHAGTSGDVRLHGQAPGFGVDFTRQAMNFVLGKGDRQATLQLRFVRANPHAQPRAAGASRTRVTYIHGQRRVSAWAYQQIVYRDLWPRIDFVAKGGHGRMEYELHLQPGADPSAIRFAYRGTGGVSLSKSGGLTIRTALGNLADAPPRSYQRIGAAEVPVKSRFERHGRNGYGFWVGNHDPARTLVIDPQLDYSTFLGGSGGGINDPEDAFGVTVDSRGNAYVAGWTPSADFPTTPGAYSTTLRGAKDAFITKLSADGSGIIWSTLLDGSAPGFGSPTSAAGPIALASDGSVVVLGITSASDFPTTPGAYDHTFHGGYDAFVARLSADGSQLLFSTLLGGNDFDFASGLALDANDQPVVTGTTKSDDFPTTPGAYNRQHNNGACCGAHDVYVTKLSADGSHLLYSTFIGGGDLDLARDLALDSEGNAYVVGFTYSGDFPTTPGGYSRTHTGNKDVFVTKLNPQGSALVYSTLIGETQSATDVFSIALDSRDDAFITGDGSPTYPVTPGLPNTGPGFVTELNAAGSDLVYSTRMHADGQAIAVNRAGEAFVSGFTRDPGFPTTPNAYDRTYNGGAEDVFLMRLDTGGNPVYSTFMGGDQSGAFERTFDIALDGRGGVYLTGLVESPDFPTTPGAWDRTMGGQNDAFVVKFQFPPGPPATLALSPKTAQNTVGTQHCVTAAVSDADGRPTADVTVRFATSGAVTGSGSSSTGADGTATYCYDGPALPGGDIITAYADANGNDALDDGEPHDSAQKTWVVPVSTPGCKVGGAGRIRAENGDRASFNGSAHVGGAGPRGRLAYVDQGPAEPLKLLSSDISAVVCSSGDSSESGTVFGSALIAGAQTGFRIDVSDAGGPGRRDTYRLRLENGYDSGAQSLAQGNLVVRSG